MSKEYDEKNKKKNETMFPKWYIKFYKNRWYWIGLMLVLTATLELQFRSVN